MKYDYFIASRWRNRDSVLNLFNKLSAKGKSVYCFLVTDPHHSIHEDPEETMKSFESTGNWRTDSMIKDIFERDMDGLKNSQTLLLLLPAGKSAHMEAGIAYGMGKRCIVIGEQKEAESLYLIFNEFYPSIDKFVSVIQKPQL